MEGHVVSAEQQHVTDAEFNILDLLWASGPLTARQITEGVYPNATDSDTSTVQKLLQRLEAKGFIARDRSAFVHIIHPTMSRTEFMGQQLEAVSKKLSGSSLVPLLVQLVEDKYFSASERKKLRKLLDEHD